MARADTNVLTTPGFHAHLTYKQADVLSFIHGSEPGDVTTPQVLSEVFSTVMEDDIAEGCKLHYLSASPESFYSTLRTLEARGLVRRVWDRTYGVTAWNLTPAGEHAARHYC